ncbi:hypothetical protein EJ02DRAFT_504277 [Clathrospora elynae]|uniref:Uncharacterized protein n=1 Tax=Clathrospora elynae TaxID=706981 RepID=A0A6A5SL53_9PLEO|nr:hypothetical protein EJ02DRAFT_504277 [Clathrospora elynae]
MNPHTNYSYPNISGSSTPTSTRSTVSYESDASSSSSSGPALMPKRSSLKPTLKSSDSTTTKPYRVSSPPSVKFSEPEPLPKPHTWPMPRPTIQLPQPLINKTPNPLLYSQYQHTPSFTLSSKSRSARYSHGPQPHAAPPPPGTQRPVSLQPPQAGSIKAVRKRISNISAPTSTSPMLDPRWSGIPLPAHFTPPTLGPGSRVASYQSTVSNFSTQSAPTVLSTKPTVAAPQGQYNILEHYIPCLYPDCSAHYTPSHAGFTYHLAQGQYSLSRQHGYCPRHATRDLKDANALCKREYESLRQNAGRKLLGVIAAEFDAFLENFREDRRLENVNLQRRQKERVLGSPQPASQTKTGKAVQPHTDEWKWQYTPRPCTSSTCKTFYSPYANHLYDFYRTPLSSSFTPMRTLCPSCAKTDVEIFEEKVREKRAGRCGWDEQEWDEWYDNAVKDREMELEFWERAQERVVREKGPARWAGGEGQGDECEGKKGRRSVFKRLFASMVV